MKHIKSAENPKYREALRLKRKKYRDETGRYLMEGVKQLKDAAEISPAVERIFVDASMADRICADNGWLRSAAERTAVLDSGLFGKLSETETSQGVVAVARKRLLCEAEFADRVSGGNVIVLDRLQDPGNIGTIIRTAEAAGYEGVIVMHGSGDIYSPKAVRAAAGSILRIPALFCREAARTADFLHGIGKKIAAACSDGAFSCFEADLREDTALVIGNEGRGISGEFINSADIKISIPMKGCIESLNAAVAAGIIMYQSVGGKY